MKGISGIIERAFRNLIPAPFTLAVLLTFLTLLLAFFLSGDQSVTSAVQILRSWQSGMWEPALLVFAVQMMLILVLGHILVLSEPMKWLMDKLTSRIHNNASAVAVVCSSTMLVAFFNWGLGLIFGAIMARKMAEQASRKNFKINYPLLGAAGYSGLMVWHAGISGSAPLKAAENGHLKSLFSAENANIAGLLPELVPTSQTIFSSGNLILFGILLLLIPSVLFLLARKTPSEISSIDFSETRTLIINPKGAEKLDASPILKYILGILLLLAFLASYYQELMQFNITPNMLNFFMLGLCILLHQNFQSFLAALDEAIVGAGAILIQFPLYFGIMGVMKDSGMVGQIAEFFTNLATETTLPLFTFLSAGLVNIFVPSGGGQWAIQGPIVMESAIKSGVSIPKAIMAFAYGDQITNMLQPFWALPLLAITKLKAREILPYSLLIMCLGIIIYVIGLLLL